MRDTRLPLHEFMMYLPKYYRRSDVVNTLMYVEGDRRAELEAIMNDIVANCYINTATWGLDIFEQMAGIYTDPSRNIEDRRAVLRSRYGGFGTATVPFLKEVASKFDNGDIEVNNIPREFVVEIEFVSTNGVPRNVPDIQRALEDTVPAHYEVRFRFRFLSWDALDIESYMWNEWDLLNLEWQQVSRG